ncbi:MAG: YdcF family protein [Myxococcaceae bacterium]|nr:YdcF family protein [Myxococcaceae bacterium]
MTAVLLASALALSVTALSVRVHRFGRRRAVPVRRQAIIVLGARVLPDGTPSEALVARVTHAVGLYRAGLGERLLFSGGGAPVSEAAAAARLAIGAGVPEAACVLEPASGSTFENARRSAELLRAHAWSDAWLVTDDFHAYRAVSHFRRVGVAVVASPVARELAMGSRARWTLREVVALLRRPWLLH